MANQQNEQQTSSEITSLKDSVDYYLRIAERALETNPKIADIHATRAQNLSQRWRYKERLAYASRILGEAKLNQKKYTEAENQLLFALEYYSKTKKPFIKADINHLLGLARYHTEDYQAALDNYLIASESFNKLGEKLSYANTLQDIGRIYFKLKNNAKAEEFFTKSLALNFTLELDKNIADIYQSLGVIAYQNKKDLAAIDYYNKAIVYYHKLIDNENIGSCYSNIGLVYLRGKELTEAYNNFETSYSYFLKSENKTGLMWSLNNTGACLASMWKLNEAEPIFLESLKLAKELSLQEGILTNYKDLSRFYEQIGDLKTSLSYLKKYDQLKDSLSRGKTTEITSKLNAKNKEVKNELEIIETESKKKSNAARTYAVLSIILLISLVLLLIYSVYFRKKKAEKQITNNKAELEKLIKERTLELQEQISERKTAEASDKLKSAFLANMSHELRTPMNAIIAFSNFLREPDVTEDRKSEYLDHISNAGDSLLGLIDDIIDIAKIESEQLKIFIQPTNINRVLNELYSLFSDLRIKNDKKHIQFKLKVDPKYNYIINTDANRLKQVLSNLLENAFKYTEKGKVEIGFDATERSVIFYVKDTGIGIPNDKYQIIFDRFKQIEYANANKTTKGTGLGLAICKNLVKLLGGEINVNSTEEKGSTFFVQIPVDSIKKQVNLGQKEKKKGKSILNSGYNWNNITILVAEDEDLNYRVLDSCLARTNANVIRAKDGESAIEICRNQKVDVVLMDIQMPGIDGYEATHEIKRMNNRTPVIVQTSFAMAGEKERCLQAGCDDIITKPLDIERLLEKINSHI